MNLETRIAVETAIATRVITDAIASGFFVSVHDGEDFALKRSQDKEAILAAMFSVDEESLIFHMHQPARASGWQRLGSVQFIYGNTGWDVIADHSANDAMDALLRGANRLSDQVEAVTTPQDGADDDAAIRQVLEVNL